jgi:putative ABC transport system permease protein
VRLDDVIEETAFSVSSNKVRSALTILGIVVGIASVIVMVAIGQGAQASITSSIESAGSNLIMVMPGFGGGGGAGARGARGAALSLTVADAEAIQSGVPGVAAVSQERSSRQQVVAGGNNTNTQIQGVTPEYATVHSTTVAEGAFLRPEDVASVGRVAVIGPTTRDDLFGVGSSAVGQSMTINGIQFKVVGVTASKGGTGFGNQDDVIFIPLTAQQQLLVGDDHLSQISVQAASSDQMTAVQQGVTELLLTRHNIGDPTQADFNVLSQSDIAATASTITGTFTVVLASIAGISLLVGGIGIMNMMLTAVTERTREIGLRKAVGARRSDISIQFLAESVALTFIGGLVGVLLGVGVSLGLKQFAGISTSVSVASVLLAAGVSIGIGVVFGYYPALRASGMNPVEALRYQ